jgi:hypothetical protein
LEKSKQNRWVVKIWVADELFTYQYLFLLPNIFSQKLNKDDFEVRFKFFQVFTYVGTTKEFSRRDFFESYSSTLSS